MAPAIPFFAVTIRQKLIIFPKSRYDALCIPAAYPLHTEHDVLFVQEIVSGKQIYPHIVHVLLDVLGRTSALRTVRERREQ